MILPYFENLVSGIEEKLRSGPQDTVARKTLALEIARLGMRLFSGKERVAWCGVLAPFDLLHAHLSKVREPSRRQHVGSLVTYAQLHCLLRCCARRYACLT